MSARRRRGRPTRVQEVLRALGIAALTLLGQLACSSNELEVHPQAEGVRLSAVPDLAEATHAAAERLLDATGLDVLSGALVVPVALAQAQAEMPSEDHCAATTTAFMPDGSGVVRVEVLVSPMVFDPTARCGDAELNVLHELGHVLRSWESSEAQRAHAESGVFMPAAAGGDGLLNEASLSYLCASAPCAWFTPELAR